MIERADLPSGGSYTAVGKYDYEEMASLVTELAQLSGGGARRRVARAP